MKRLFIQLNVATVLFFAFSFHCMATDKYTLEYKLEKGKTYKQRMISDMITKMDIMGQDVNMNMISEMAFNFDVIGQNNDVYDVQITYQKIKMDVVSPMLFTIDSDSPENSSDKNIAEVFSSLVELPIDIQLTKQGKVVSVKGVDKLAEKMNAINNEQLKPMFGQMLSEKAIQSTLEQSTSFFPDKPVAIGDGWDVALNLNSGGIDIINKIHLTLKQVEDNVATLEYASTVATPEGGSVMQIQGMDAKVLMEGEQTGTVLIDMETGWIIRSEITLNSTQSIEVMGQSITQKAEAKSTVIAE